MKLSAVLMTLLLAACASAPPPEGPLAPEWDVIPPGIAEALCVRMKIDAIATGRLAVVNVTQPLATPLSLGALGNLGRGRPRKDGAAAQAQVNRAIPVGLAQGSCTWIPVEVRDVQRHADEMLLEMSAPLPNPYVANEAGMFVRVSLGGEHANWYWLPLLPSGGGWTAGMALPLSF
ncbi:MAG TPA: hypothetical protein VGF28_24430 [Thermoanaerobaculia bacterium]